MPETRDPTDSTTVKLEDSSLVAFLKLKGHTIIPYLSDDDPRDPERVAFDISGNEEAIKSDISNYYNDNPLVGIGEYVRSLKDVKSQMYITRQNRKGDKR